MAIKQKDISLINDFRYKFGKIGMPSLIILLITGILSAYDYDVTFYKWFSFSTAIETIVSIKLLLVFATLAAVIYTQKFVFPKLTSQNMMPTIIGISIVTFFSVAMLILGSFVRIGSL